MKSVLKRSCSRFQLTEAIHSMWMQICDKLPLEVNKLQDCMQQLFPYLSLSEKTNFYTSFFHFCRLLCSVSIFARPLFFSSSASLFAAYRWALQKLSWCAFHNWNCFESLSASVWVVCYKAGFGAQRGDFRVNPEFSGSQSFFWLPAGVHRLGNLSHTPNVHLSRLSIKAKINTHKNHHIATNLLASPFLDDPSNLDSVGRQQ